MPLNLGSSAVSLKLGSQSVNAYLGATLVTPPAGPFTLYWNAAVDNEWTTLGNWWLNSGYTIAATALPAAEDSVIMSVSGAATNSGSEPTVANLTIDGIGISINITVTGAATLLTNAYIQANITGDVTFNGSSYNDFGYTVTGNATFNDTSVNYGTVVGNATFNGSSSLNSGAIIDGNATFNESSTNNGTVNGSITDNR